MLQSLKIFHAKIKMIHSLEKIATKTNNKLTAHNHEKMEEVQLITFLCNPVLLLHNIGKIPNVIYVSPMYTFVCSMQKCDGFVCKVFLCTVILIKF